MPFLGSRVLLATILFLTACAVSPRLALAAIGDEVSDPRFPRPPALQPNIDFWRQVYSEYGVGDFVLHDRENLGIIYDVVHIGGTANECRAAAAAKPEIQRLRQQYAGILESLAQGVPPEGLGPEGVRVAPAWGC